MSGAVEAELDALLAESVAPAKLRASSLLGHLAGSEDGPFVLFGAGNLGRRTAAKLRELGREVRAFADNDAAAWGTTRDGIPVLAPAGAAKRHPDATFVVTIWGAGHRHRYPTTREQLLALGAKHVAPFGALAWRHPDSFLPYFAMDLPHRVLERAADVRRAYALLSDDDSRAEFVTQLRWRLTLDYAGLRCARWHERQYFELDLFTLRADESFVDGGAYIGDTLDGFRAFTSDRFAHALLVEADPRNHATLTEHVAKLAEPLRARVCVVSAALGSHAGRITIDATGTAASAVGKGDVEVDLVPLDAIATAHPPTFVKLDIEGAELDALAGGAKTIVQHRPVMAVCSYHLQPHLWQVPNALGELMPDARFALRAYSEECYDLVCYAVPPERS